MPIFPPPPFGTNINFVRIDDTISVTYNSITTINTKEQVTIQPDFDYPITSAQTYPVVATFMHNDGSGAVLATVNTTLDRITFDGVATTDEDDYIAKVESLFFSGDRITGTGVGSCKTLQDITNCGAVTTAEITTGGMRAGNTYYKNGYILNNTFTQSWQNQAGTIALLSDIPTTLNRNIDGGSATAVYASYQTVNGGGA